MTGGRCMSEVSSEGHPTPALCVDPPHREEGVSSAFADRIVETARSWIGTPYRHQASLKGVGCDCLGLVRGVWREIYGGEPELPPAYQPDWAERSGEDRLRDAARRHFGARDRGG